MKIPLNQFETHISESTLKKGLSYFNKGKVTELETIEKGLIQATVEGTEPYTVTLFINNETMTDCSCTCPYDHDAICKHVCAVLFYLQQEHLSLPQPKIKKPKDSTKSGKERAINKPKSVRQQLEDMIDNIPTDELRSYIKKLTINKKFKEQFLIDFSHYNKHEKMDIYLKKVKSFITESRTNYGYPYKVSARIVSMQCRDYLKKAEEHLENGNYKTAFYMNGAVLKNFTDHYLNFDEDGDYIEITIERALNTIIEINKINNDEKLKKEIFKFFLSFINDDGFIFSPYYSQITSLTIELAPSKSDLDLIEEILIENSIEDDDHFDLSTYIYDIILKRDGADQAIKFANKNIDKFNMRFHLIDNLIDEKKIDEAEKLIDEGLKLHKSRKEGVFYSELNKVKLSIAIFKKDIPAILKTASELIAESFFDEYDYYAIIKEFCPTEEWPALFEKITTLNSKHGIGLSYNQIAFIYHREELWDDLMAWITKFKSIDMLDEFYEDLMPTHGDQVIELYGDLITIKAESCNHRIHYQEITRYLRHLREIGGKEKFLQLKQEFLRLYKHKSAFVQELNKL